MVLASLQTQDYPWLRLEWRERERGGGGGGGGIRWSFRTTVALTFCEMGHFVSLKVLGQGSLMSCSEEKTT